MILTEFGKFKWFNLKYGLGVYTESHLRETVCRRNSDVTCQPLEHLKLRYKKTPHACVFVGKMLRCTLVNYLEISFIPS